MKIYFLHGLESNGLSRNKRKEIENLGHQVHAPLIDYKQGPIFYELMLKIKKYNPDMLIGSSIGGRMAYHLSNKMKIPAILFNPAIDKEKINVLQPIPEELSRFKKQLFIFGEKDKVIDYKYTISKLPKGIEYNIIEGMGHRVPAIEISNALQNFKF